MSLEITFALPSPAAGATAETVRRAALGAFGIEDDGVSVAFEIGRPETGSTCLLRYVEGDQAGASADGAQEASRRGAGLGPRVVVDLPTLRAPFFVEDVVAPLEVAARSLSARIVDDAGRELPSLADYWTAAYRRAAEDTAAICRETGAPLPAHLPAAELANLHRWLIALGGTLGAADEAAPVSRALLGLDFRDSEKVTVATLLPASGTWRLPPAHAILFDPAAKAGSPEAPEVWTFEDVVGHHSAPDAQGLYPVDVDDALRARLRVAVARPLAAARIVSPVEIIESEALGL